MGHEPFLTLLSAILLVNQVCSLSERPENVGCSSVFQEGKEIPRKALYRRDDKRSFGQPGKESHPVEKKQCKAHMDSSPVNLTGQPRDCADILARGVKISGIYAIYPGGKGNPFNVFCDMDTNGGGWTVFQRRMDGSVDFNRNWSAYKNGFGSVSSEHWLGNDKIHRLTNQMAYEIRIDLEAFDGRTSYARYGRFHIANESRLYTLTGKAYSGTAGNSLQHHFGVQFSTADRDTDHLENRNCATQFKAGWWYSACFRCNLNGVYFPEDEAIDYGRHQGVIWQHWLGFGHSLKSTEMKIRPV